MLSFERKYQSSFSNISAVEVFSELNGDADIVINSASAGVLKEELVLPKNIFGPESKVYDLSYSKSKRLLICMPKNWV